jgi:hypothetical protein
MEKSTDKGVQPHIGEMPQPVEPYEQQHQNATHHTIIAQLRLPAGRYIETIENLFKLDQVQKLDQPQKPAKRAYLLGASLKNRGSTDFSGSLLYVSKTFTDALFPVMLLSLFNHLGDLLFWILVA